MNCPKVIFFDLDDTLAPSYQSPSAHMLDRLAKLVQKRPIAIISGASFERIYSSILSSLPHVEDVFVFPNSSTQCYQFRNNTWENVYDTNLTDEDKKQIRIAIEESFSELPFMRDASVKGEQIVDRGAQIALALVGVDSLPEEKSGWDPQGDKRRAVRDLLVKKLPDFEMLLGGTSTIDITRKGFNKAHGVRWLSQHLGVLPGDMYYVGDALYPGGNDYVVIETGIVTRITSGPVETLGILDELLAACEH